MILIIQLVWDVNSASFDSPDPFHSSRPFHRIKHNCQTGKWLTMLKAQWSPNPDVYPHFTVVFLKHLFALLLISSRSET